MQCAVDQRWRNIEAALVALRLQLREHFRVREMQRLNRLKLGAVANPQ